MMRKFHEAKENGNVSNSLAERMREFLFVDDMAQAVVFLH
jgi:nucleoside-diphosphate-sugar epimerase